MFEDEGDGLSIVVSGAASIAARFEDHAETLESVDHLGVADEEISSGGFCLVEATGVDQIDDGVGCGVEVIVLVPGGGGECASRFGGAGASFRARQQRLYFLPLPHGHG